MGIVQQVNALIWSWAEMIRALRRGAALLPFLLYAAVQGCVVLVLVGFAYAPLSAIAAPAMRWRFGEQALHYPNNFFVLRSALGQVDTFLCVLLGAVVSAAAIYLFAEFYSGRRERHAAGWRAAGAKYLPLVAIAASVMALTQLVTWLPFSLWGHLADEAPNRFRLMRAASVAVVVGVQALFVYALPYIMVSGRRLIAAAAGSFSLAVKNPITTYLLVGVPAALELLPLWLSKKSGVIAYRLSPEFLVVTMAIWIAVILVSSYATMGAATRFFLHATQDEEAQGPSGREG